MSTRQLALGLALGVTGLSAQAQVVADTADGLWYEAVYVGSAGITWNDAEAAAVALGGQLATPMDSSQNNFVYGLVTNSECWTGLSIHADRLGPWLGIYSSTPGVENFVYAGTGTALGSFHPWGPNQPDGYGGGTQAVDFYAFASEGPTWGDTPEAGTTGFPLPTGYVVQFNADPVPEASGATLALAAIFGGLAWRAWARRPSGPTRPSQP